jgi:hypothetical protein
MSMLEDGTVVPSYLRTRTRDFVGNFALKMGEVKEILYPENERNLSGKFTEYVVRVQEWNPENGAWGVITYTNCVVSSLFGGLADFLSYTVRPDDGTSQPPLVQGDKPDPTLGNGSQVLILCANGMKTSPLIVGGWPTNGDDSSEANGHYLHFNFNGIDALINNDGEFTFTFGGATQADGSLADGVDSDSSNGSISFTKDGNIQIADGSGEQLMLIDHQNKKMVLTADSEYDVTVSNGNMIIKSNGVLVGAATDAWVLGTTYRNAESQMMKQVSTALAAATRGLASAAQALVTASSLMSTGPAGNIPAAGPVATAASQLVQAGTALAQAKSAIDKFESGASTYLSQKNLTD